jgi:uncharacterized protein YqeY
MNTPKALISEESPYPYTDEGRACLSDAKRSLIPIFHEFIEKGYTPAQIMTVAYEAVAEVSREIRDDHQNLGEDAARAALRDKAQQGGFGKQS